MLFQYAFHCILPRFLHTLRVFVGSFHQLRFPYLAPASTEMLCFGTRGVGEKWHNGLIAFLDIDLGSLEKHSESFGLPGQLPQDFRGASTKNSGVSRIYISADHVCANE